MVYGIQTFLQINFTNDGIISYDIRNNSILVAIVFQDWMAQVSKIYYCSMLIATNLHEDKMNSIHHGALDDIMIQL